MEWTEWSGNLHSHMTADVCAPTTCSTPCYALQVTKIMIAWQLFVELMIASWARRQVWGDADATAIHVTQPHHVIILTRPSLYRVNFLAIVMLITHRLALRLGKPQNRSKDLWCLVHHMVSQATPFPERGRVWSHCNYRVVAKEIQCNYQK